MKHAFYKIPTCKTSLRVFLLILCALLPAATVLAQDNVLPSWALGAFQRPEGCNPLIEPLSTTTFFCPHRKAEVKWECADTFNPAAVVRGDSIYILYRAEDDPSAGIGGRTSRIGLAASKDGIHIDYRSPVPVMYPDGSEISATYEWKGGCEDPRVVEKEDGTYVMTFTSWNNKVPRLSIATSTDLRHWTHHGPAFTDAFDGKFKDLSCKSGSIVTEIVNGRQVMARVNGKYLMYWGEQFVAAATSDDAIHWTPVCDANTNIVKIIVPRKKHFDSSLTECGPPAVITDDGIVLVYNGKNASSFGDMDQNYPAATYAAGQVLFDKNDYMKVKARLDNAFFRPMVSYEKSGQYAAGTVFVEGLVYKDSKWYLYYGCADSKVSVAVYDPAAGSKVGDPIAPQVPEGVINAFPANGTGKLRCTIHSYSGCTKGDESPFYLNYSYINPKKKWCDTSTEHPWVVFELMDYYNINRIDFRDVSPFEQGNGNVPEYWIYTSTTGTADADWTLQAHKTDQGGLAVKSDTLTGRPEARYIKLVLSRGTRTDNGNKENAVRIYGVDIYGDYSRPVERNGIVSVGKTVKKFYDCTNERETALNLLDNNATDKNTKWCFYEASTEKDPYKYVVVDLEKLYNISKFVIYDCKNIETDENMDAYQIYVSESMPDLELITPAGDSNTCWKKVVDRSGAGGEKTKTDVLSNPVAGRYVKLVVPHVEAGVNAHTSRIYGLDVYGTETTDAIGKVSADDGLHLFPTILCSGGSLNANNSRTASLCIYGMDGTLLSHSVVEPGGSVAVSLPKGVYLAQLKEGKKVCSEKILVR
jgi:predicted GH43/DUF377 family glycosyl hydrolase